MEMQTKICQLSPIIISIIAIVVMMPGMPRDVASQQMRSGMHVGGRGVHSMGMMSEIMKDMEQLMKEPQATPEQRREMSGMIDQMGQVMQEMATPQPGEVEERHHRQLQEMQKRLKALKKEVLKQKKGQVQPGPKP
jgi:glycine/serine hydroxymethyltransferase